jgi:hypothetical protein
MAQLNKNTIKILAVGLMALSFAVFSTGSARAATISTAEVVKLLNQARLANGMGALNESSILDQAALGKADDMVKNDYFAHTSPTGVDPWFWFKKAGYDYKFAGENLAVNYTSAEDQHKAWMNSPTHRKNMLNPDYREVGVAVVKENIDGENSLLTVEMFGAPMYAPIESGAAGTPIPKEQQVKASEDVLVQSAPADNLVLQGAKDGSNFGYLKNLTIVNPLTEGSMHWIVSAAVLALLLVGVIVLVRLVVLFFRVYEILAIIREEAKQGVIPLGV